MARGKVKKVVAEVLYLIFWPSKNRGQQGHVTVERSKQLPVKFRTVGHKGKLPWVFEDGHSESLDARVLAKGGKSK